MDLPLAGADLAVWLNVMLLQTKYDVRIIRI